jgi:hypothetical protein
LVPTVIGIFFWGINPRLHGIPWFLSSSAFRLPWRKKFIQVFKNIGFFCLPWFLSSSAVCLP